MGKSGWRLLAALVLGAFIGAAATSVYTGRRVEQVYVERGVLLRQLISYRTDLQNLTSKMENRYQPVISQVEIDYVNLSDKPLRLKLDKQLKPLTGQLVGQKLETLDPHLLINIFEGRQIRIDTTRYILHVKSIILAPHTILILQVDKEKVNPKNAD